jgi:predicted lipoprotein with Yx(FWY)xxD motif
MNRILLAATVLSLGAFTAACAANGSPAASQTTTAAPMSSVAPSSPGASPLPGDAGPTPRVATAANPKLGTILTDGNGATLYLFEKDTPNHSNCTGDCAEDWYPFTTSKGAAAAGPGTTASMIATITRADGSTQVTYNSHPLYYYSDDKKKPGDTEGQGSSEYGGLWYTVSPAGTADTAKK